MKVVVDCNAKEQGGTMKTRVLITPAPYGDHRCDLVLGQDAVLRQDAAQDAATQSHKTLHAPAALGVEPSHHLTPWMKLQTLGLGVLSGVSARWPALLMAGVVVVFVMGLLGVVGGVLIGDPAWAQQINVDLGPGSTVTGRVVQLIALLTVLTLAPSIVVMVTSFTRIVVVLSLLRSAIGTQQTPPNAVLTSLALFLSLFIMQPTLEVAYLEGVQPLVEGLITDEEAFTKTIAPFREFMLAHVRPTDLALFFEIGDIQPVAAPAETPLRALIPAFMISELKRAFEIGFLLFIPFLIIDLVVASILMAMGIMMLPPIVISLPFKLIFFVLVDGWSLVVSSLVRSFISSGS